MREPTLGLVATSKMPDIESIRSKAAEQDLVCRVINTDKAGATEHFFSILRDPTNQRPPARVYSENLAYDGTFTDYAVCGSPLKVFRYQKMAGLVNKYVALPPNYDPKMPYAGESWVVTKQDTGKPSYVVHHRRGAPKPYAKATIKLNWSIYTEDEIFFSPAGGVAASQIVYCIDGNDLSPDGAVYSKVNAATNSRVNVTWWVDGKEPLMQANKSLVTWPELKSFVKTFVDLNISFTSNTDILAGIKIDTLKKGVIKAIFPRYSQYVTSRVTAWIAVAKTHETFGYFPLLMLSKMKEYTPEQQVSDIITVFVRSCDDVSDALKLDDAQKQSARKLMRQINFAYCAPEFFSTERILALLDSLLPSTDLTFNCLVALYQNIKPYALLCDNITIAIVVMFVEQRIKKFREHLKLVFLDLGEVDRSITEALKKFSVEPVHTSFIKAQVILKLIGSTHIRMDIDKAYSEFVTAYANPKATNIYNDLSVGLSTCPQVESLASHLLAANQRQLLYQLIEDNPAFLAFELPQLTPDRKFADGYTLAHSLCRDGRIGSLMLLHSDHTRGNFFSGVQMHSDYRGWEPMHFAAAMHHWGVVDMSIELVGASEADFDLLRKIYAGQIEYASHHDPLIDLLTWVREKRYHNLAHALDTYLTAGHCTEEPGSKRKLAVAETPDLGCKRFMGVSARQDLSMASGAGPAAETVDLTSIEAPAGIDYAGLKWDVGLFGGLDNPSAAEVASAQGPTCLPG